MNKIGRIVLEKMGVPVWKIQFPENKFKFYNSGYVQRAKKVQWVGITRYPPFGQLVTQNAKDGKGKKMKIST